MAISLHEKVEKLAQSKDFSLDSVRRVLWNGFGSKKSNDSKKLRLEKNVCKTVGRDDT